MNAAPWPMFDEFVATRYLDRKPVGVKRPHAQVWSSRVLQVQLLRLACDNDR